MKAFVSEAMFVGYRCRAARRAETAAAEPSPGDGASAVPASGCRRSVAVDVGGAAVVAAVAAGVVAAAERA